MKKYERPMLNVIELDIKESIAALVPKTVYKKKSSGSGFNNSYSAESDVAELDAYGTSNQTV